jgi:hypothetical protein
MRFDYFYQTLLQLIRGYGFAIVVRMLNTINCGHGSHAISTERKCSQPYHKAYWWPSLPVEVRQRYVYISINLCYLSGC